MKKRSNLFLYLLLNVIVSAATTLGVLYTWDRVRKATLPAELTNLPTAAAAAAQDSHASSTPGAVQPTDTLPPLDQPIIDFVSVVGAGNLDQEVIVLKRAGGGNLDLSGWKISGEHNNTYTFPSQPALILYQDGAIQVFTKTGADTATEVYWNRDQAAWSSGEQLHIYDSQGNERAAYRVP